MSTAYKYDHATTIHSSGLYCTIQTLRIPYGCCKQMCLVLLKGKGISPKDLVSFLLKLSCHQFYHLAICKEQPFLIICQKIIFSSLQKICLTKLSCPWDVFNVESAAKGSGNFQCLICVITIPTCLTSYSLASKRSLVCSFHLELTRTGIA